MGHPGDATPTPGRDGAIDTTAPAALSTRPTPAPQATRQVHAYEYDRLYRLVGATATEGGATVRDADYAYDPAGNRTSRARGGTTTAYQYDRADRVTNVGGRPYSHPRACATSSRALPAAGPLRR